jgi:hypothetical protein
MDHHEGPGGSSSGNRRDARGAGRLAYDSTRVLIHFWIGRFDYFFGVGSSLHRWKSFPDSRALLVMCLDQIRVGEIPSTAVVVLILRSSTTDRIRRGVMPSSKSNPFLGTPCTPPGESKHPQKGTPIDLTS